MDGLREITQKVLCFPGLFTKENTVKILIFLVVLIGFFAGLLAICYQTMGSSLTVDNPGLEFVPMPDTANVENTLIYYRPNEKGSVLKWTGLINQYLRPYRNSSGSGAENRVYCTAKTGPLGEKQVCDVPVEDFHPCTSYNQYNYEEGTPCVFLKLNENFNWKPEPYNTTTNLPADMPSDLKQHIMHIADHPDVNTVWVSCEGENPADKENIGPVQYIPRRGFPAYYFPYTNKEGYLSPLVAVLFEKPKPGVLINIECRAWAKNLLYDRYEGRGRVHFELMVDHH